MQRKTLGIAIIVIGIIIMIYTGFNYVTTEKVVDMGPLKISKEKNHAVSWPSITGSILLIGGIVIIINDRKVRT
jgi:hypothetical protein